MSYSIQDLNPVFQRQTRTPLGKGYPASPSPNLPRKSTQSLLKKKPSGTVQGEYVRNLQQQIYLLELESRYLKTGQPAYPTTQQSKSPSPYASIQSLHDDPIQSQDPQDFDIQVNELEEKLKKLSSQLGRVESERDELIKDVKANKERFVTEKDKIYGDLIATRKKAETALSEQSRAELSYARVLMEKERVDSQYLEVRDELEKMKDQVASQLVINSSLKSRVDEITALNNGLNVKIKDQAKTISDFNMDELNSRIKKLNDDLVLQKTLVKQKEVEMGQLDHAKSRSDDEIKALVSQNVILKHDLDTTRESLSREIEQKQVKKTKSLETLKQEEELRSELSRLKDDLGMLKISGETKDRKINELSSTTKSLESAQTKNIEMKLILSEKLTELENRLRSNEHELIQTGQDKSLLADDVASLKNQLEGCLSKQSTLISTNQELKSELEEYKRELATLSNFAQVLDQAESNGQNYLALMRDMRKHLDVKPRK